MIPGLGRSPGGGNGNPLQYSCLGNPKDRGAWWATIHGDLLCPTSKNGLRYSQVPIFQHFENCSKSLPYCLFGAARSSCVQESSVVYFVSESENFHWRPHYLEKLLKM